MLNIQLWNWKRNVRAFVAKKKKQVILKANNTTIQFNLTLKDFLQNLQIKQIQVCYRIFPGEYKYI